MERKEAQRRWISLGVWDGSISERRLMLNGMRGSSVDFHRIYHGLFIPAVRPLDPTTGGGVGALDSSGQDNESSLLHSRPTEGVFEKWWCLRDARNRFVMWAQGDPLG